MKNLHSLRKLIVRLASTVALVCLLVVPVAMALRHISSDTSAKRTAPAASKTASKTVTKTTASKPVVPAKTTATAPPLSKPTPPAPAPPPQPAPQPVAASQPAPGSGVKQLQPTTSTPPAQPATQTSGTTTSGASSSSSAPAAATGGYYSTNWSGYAAQQGTFTTVSGSWTIPAVTGPSGVSSGDAAWIGIGGISSSDLIQVGTDNTVAPDGTVSSYAFYELLPAAALDITALPVKTGDGMAASITESSPGVWAISITNTTSGQSYATTVSYASSHSSADWVEEDPSYTNGSLVPFDSFDHVSFTQGNTTENGVLTSIADSNASPMTLVDASHQPLATPSVLLNGGTGFWVSHN